MLQVAVKAIGSPERVGETEINGMDGGRLRRTQGELT